MISVQKNINAVDPLHSTAADDANDPFNPRMLATRTDVVWTYLVTNPGLVPLTIDWFTDDAGTADDPTDDFIPEYVSGDGNSNNMLDPGEKWLFTSEDEFSYQVEDGFYGNVATIRATGSTGQTVTAVDANYHFGTTPSLFVMKAINALDPENPTTDELAQAAPGRELPVGTAVVWTGGEAPIKLTSIRDDAGTPSFTGDDSPRPRCWKSARTSTSATPTMTACSTRARSGCSPRWASARARPSTGMPLCRRF